jgi:hypothetical protein
MPLIQDMPLSKDQFPSTGLACGKKLGLTTLLGGWVPTHSVHGFSRIEFREESGALVVKTTGGLLPFGNGENSFLCEAVYASDHKSDNACAISATSNHETARVHIHANASLGLLIVATLCEFSSDSPLEDYYLREFYRRENTAEPIHSPVDGKLPNRESRNGMDLGEFAGQWRTTDAATAEISGILLERTSSGLMAKIDATRPGDFSRPEIHLQAFAAPTGPPGASSFYGRWRGENGETECHAWIKQGVLVIAKFERSLTAGRSNKFSREFFYRVALR